MVYCIHLYPQKYDEGLILTLLQESIHARCTKTRYHHLLSFFIFFIVCKILGLLARRARRSERNCKK